MRTAPTCKTCRRIGLSVCGRKKCALTRKPYAPGIHGKTFRRNVSEFGQQLRQKQRARFLYNIRERQFKHYVEKALRQKAMGAPDALLTALETRLDNVMYRLGFFATRAAARQAISHGHVTVNGRRVTIPSYHVKIGEELAIQQASVGKALFSELDITLKKYVPPVWLALDKDKKSGHMIVNHAKDTLEGLAKDLNSSAIIEFYSR